MYYNESGHPARAHGNFSQPRRRFQEIPFDLFFASRTKWKIYVVRRGVDARLKFFLGVWMRVGNYETSEEKNG